MAGVTATTLFLDTELQNRVDQATRVPQPHEEAAERQGREARGAHAGH